jgi:hypothetical protein
LPRPCQKSPRIAGKIGGKKSCSVNDRVCGGVGKKKKKKKKKIHQTRSNEPRQSRFGRARRKRAVGIEFAGVSKLTRRRKQRHETPRLKALQPGLGSAGRGGKKNKTKQSNSFVSVCVFVCASVRDLVSFPNSDKKNKNKNRPQCTYMLGRPSVLTSTTAKPSSPPLPLATRKISIPRGKKIQIKFLLARGNLRWGLSQSSPPFY